MKLKVILVTILILVSGCAEEQPVELEKITVATFKGDISALVYFAEARGIFEKNNLGVEIIDFAGGKSAAEAMLSGEADVTTSSSSVFVNKGFTNPDLRTIATISTFEPLELVARKDKGISQTSDLINKKVGVTKGSSGEFFLEIFLLFNDLGLEDIEVIDLPPQEIVDSVIEGSIDAGFTWEPHIYNLKKALRDNAISWLGQGGQEGHFLLLTTQKWIDKDPEVVRSFIESVLESQNFAEKNPEEFKEFTRLTMDYKEDYVDYVWPRNEFVVSLPQTFLISAEDQARWAIANGLTNVTEVPNYLNYIYFDALDEVKPEAVTIIH